MIYTVTLDGAVDFAPQNEVAEILQNVRTILSGFVGSAPLHRDFGLSWEHLDKPLPVAYTLLQASVIEAIEEFEPRATVQSVEFEDTSDMDAQEGRLRPRVIISIGDEEEY